MAFNRNQFKATQASALKEQEQSVNDMLYQKNRKYLRIEDGTNKIRFFPAHPGTSNFIYPKVVSWIPILVEKKDDKGNVIKEIMKKPIFNSRVHGKTKKDLVEEYLKFVTLRITEEIQDETERNKKLFPVNNFKGKYNLTNRSSWVAYVKKVNGDNSSDFGLIELTVGIKSQMNTIANINDEDAPIAVDPFSHPDNGKQLKIYKNPKAEDKKKIYTCTLLWQPEYDSPLSDKELEEFMKFDSLESLFVNSFKRSDFEKQLEGLQIIDQECNFNIFSDDAWLDIVEEINGYYPEEAEEVTNDETTTEENTSETTQSDDAKPWKEGEVKEEVKEEVKPIEATQNKVATSNARLDSLKNKYAKPAIEPGGEKA